MKGRHRSWTDDQLREALATCRSTADVIRKLGLRQGGGTHQQIKHRMALLGLTFTEHDPHAWMKSPTANKGGRMMPLDLALTCPSPYLNNGKLRLRLVRAGLKTNTCERCGISDWLEEPITMQLDHINGNRSDNRIENLRMLCPNCHAQTETWCRQKPVPPT